MIVANLTAKAIPDLAVINGGSGTITLLPGVGGGFFNDQNPQVVLDFGSAIVQSPTFVGSTALGYVVTAGEGLMRFNLDDTGAGASLVYSAQQVVAAQAIANGQVVAAISSGLVELLAPQGSGLSVQSQLLANAGIPLCQARSTFGRNRMASSTYWSAASAPTISLFSRWEARSCPAEDYHRRAVHQPPT